MKCLKLLPINSSEIILYPLFSFENINKGSRSSKVLCNLFYTPWQREVFAKLVKEKLDFQIKREFE